MTGDVSSAGGEPAQCLCSSLADLAAIPMGDEGLDERVFATLERVREHGSKLWWLYLSQCGVCAQHWLVAQDERIYDTFYLKRLGPAAAQDIIASGNWPDDFITYERVLQLGSRMAPKWQFQDPFAHSLQFTVEDLRKERPNISPREIAVLLGITGVQARKLFWKVRLLGAAKLPD